MLYSYPNYVMLPRIVATRRSQQLPCDTSRKRVRVVMKKNDSTTQPYGFSIVDDLTKFR